MSDNYKNAGTITLTAGGALTAFTLVYDNSGTATNTSATSTKHIGVVMKDVGASGDLVAIQLPAVGVQKVVASAAISAGAALTYAASGKVVTAAGGDLIIGYAITASTTDGDVISAILYQVGQTYGGDTAMLLTAGATVTANKLVQDDGSGKVIYTTATSDDIIGVCQDGGSTSDSVNVLPFTVGPVTLTNSTGNIAIGDELMLAASGQVTAHDGSNALRVGIAVSARTGAGTFSALLYPKPVREGLVTLTAGAAVTAGKLVEFSGVKVIHCTASSTAGLVGVSLDAGTDTTSVRVATPSYGPVTLVGSEAITAGALITYAAAGEAATWSSVTADKYIIGRALTACSGASSTFTASLFEYPQTDLQSAVDVIEVDLRQSAAQTHEGITITLSSAIADNAVTLNGTAYTFKASPASAVQVQLGATDTLSAANLAAKINSLDGWIASSSAAVVTAYFPTAITATENTGATTIVIAAVSNDHSNAYLDTRVTNLESAIGTTQLSLPAAAGDIANKRIVQASLDTVMKWTYASHTAIAQLFGYVATGASAGANCTAIPWCAAATHVVNSSAAAVAVGDVVVVVNGTGQVMATTGANQVAVGRSNTAVGAGGGDITVIPCVPYLT